MFKKILYVLPGFCLLAGAVFAQQKDEAGWKKLRELEKQMVVVKDGKTLGWHELDWNTIDEKGIRTGLAALAETTPDTALKAEAYAQIGNSFAKNFHTIFERVQDLEKSKEAYFKALEIDPTNQNAQYQVGWSLTPNERKNLAVEKKYPCLISYIRAANGWNIDEKGLEEIAKANPDNAEAQSFVSGKSASATKSFIERFADNIHVVNMVFDQLAFSKLPPPEADRLLELIYRRCKARKQYAGLLSKVLSNMSEPARSKYTEMERGGGAKIKIDKDEILINDFRNPYKWSTQEAGLVPEPMPGPKADIPGMALPCQFSAGGWRASWVWEFEPRDLSKVSFFTIWFYCEDWQLLKGFSLYFLSEGGYLVNYNVSVLPMNGWQQIMVPKGSFGLEGNPTGWEQISGVQISLANNAPRDGKFGIARWTATSGYANMLLNSGFEYSSIPGMPDGWGYGYGGLPEPWTNDPEGFRRHWLLEPGGDPNGKQCMRLNADAQFSPQLVSIWHSLTAGQDYTLSCLLKASEQDYPVWLGTDVGGGSIKVDTAWRRYQQTFKASRTAMAFVYVRGEKPGSLWVDDVQLEEGPQETPWKESPVDRTLTKPLPPSRPLPKTEKTALPWQPIHRTEVDKNGIFRVDGKAHIPFAPGFSAFDKDPIHRATLEATAKNGIRTVVLNVCGTEWKPVLSQLLDDCSQLQLAAIVWVNIGDKEMEDAISKYKTHPAVLAWKVADEPAGDLTPIKARVLKAKELDPDHCAFVNYAAGVNVSFGDLVSIDYYPVPFGGAGTVGPVVESAAAVATPAHKPLWIWLQGALGYQLYVPREPTAEEEEGMTYLALLGGARGLMYWHGRPSGDRLWSRMGSLAFEVEQLTPALAEGKTINLVQEPKEPVKTRAYRLGNDLYVISVNAGDSPCRVELRIPDAKAEARARVLFENREKEVNQGVINEQFEAYERHVFFFPGWYL